MVEYIKQYITLFMSSVQQQKGGPKRDLAEETRISPFVAAEAIATELNRLDPRDFEPSSQCEFLRLRGEIAYCAKPGIQKTDRFLKAVVEVSNVLDRFRGAGSWGPPESFPISATRK